MDAGDSSLIEQVERAAATIAGHVAVTPCVHSRTLSQLLGAQIYLKLENLQFTASFKERGALNKLVSLSEAQRARGVIAVSAGNHALGVAYHAQRLGIPAVIVMPRLTPTVKTENTRHFGAEIVLHGESFDEAREHALALAHERGLAMVHPYDDAMVIAGQGTIGLELLQQQPELQAVVVPIGGGGLISGIGAVFKQRRPEVEIIGVQTDRFPYMVNAIRGSALVGSNDTIAEGIAVKTPGELTRVLIRQYVDDLLLVEEGDIEQAILMYLEIEKTVVEGAGAASLAAMFRHRDRFRGKRVGVVVSGGNLDPLLLVEIIKRGMVRAGRLARVHVELRDIPGALAAISSVVANLGANIEEITHQRAFTALPAKNAELDMILHTRNHQHVEQIIAALSAAGYPAQLHNR